MVFTLSHSSLLVKISSAYSYRILTGATTAGRKVPI